MKYFFLKASWLLLDLIDWYDYGVFIEKLFAWCVLSIPTCCFFLIEQTILIGFFCGISFNITTVLIIEYYRTSKKSIL